jgi:hypothetical protein
MSLASQEAWMMKSITRYIAALRELVRGRICTLSEYNRTERKHDESLKRHYSRIGGREPTIAKGREPKLPERE